MSIPTQPLTLPVPMLDVNRQNQPLASQINAAIQEVTSTGTFINGPACREFEEAFASYVGVSHAVGCASGSDALLLPLMALGIGPGDEVLVPSFTFFATASAVERLGAKAVFVDILPDTFNIDPRDAAQKVTPATKALIPVHLFGQAADMSAILSLAQEHQLTVIEDAAQAIGATAGGTRVGALGDFGAFSFYPTKNLGGYGDGGMITTNNDDWAEMLRRLRNHGQHPRYHHHLIGINSRLDALQAAALNVKLPHVDTWGAARAERAERYHQEFEQRGLSEYLGLPTIADGVTSVWNQYTVRVKQRRRDELQQALNAEQIGSAIYYPIPLHLQPCFKKHGVQPSSLPHTEQAAEEVLSLPMFPEMTEEEQMRVIDAVTHFCQTGTIGNTPTCIDALQPSAGANIDLPSSKST